MKTKLFTFFLLLGFLHTNAQVVNSIGIKGGVSVSSLTYQYNTAGITLHYDNKVGFFSVLTAEFFKGKYFSLSTDLGFIQKGMRQKIEETTPQHPEGTGKYKIWNTTLSYVSFSPMLKVQYSFNSLTTYALLGPRMDYRLMVQSPIHTHILTESNKQIWGLTYGVGTEYPINKFSILIECLGHPDFTEILNKEASIDASSLIITGNSYVLTLGIKYHIN